MKQQLRNIDWAKEFDSLTVNVKGETFCSNMDSAVKQFVPAEYAKKKIIQNG